MISKYGTNVYERTESAASGSFYVPSYGGTMAVNSLYNIVDSYFVAQLSENAMTALSLVYPIQNLVTSIAVGFGIGINATAPFSLEPKRKIPQAVPLPSACFSA